MVTDWTKVKVNLNFSPRAVKGRKSKQMVMVILEESNLFLMNILLGL